MSDTVLRSASKATISVFDTLSQVAHAATQAVDALAIGANVLHRTMRDFDADHADRSALHRKTYRSQLLEDTAAEIAKRQLKIIADLAADPEFEKVYEETLDELEAVFADGKDAKPKPKAKSKAKAKAETTAQTETKA